MSLFQQFALYSVLNVWIQDALHSGSVVDKHPGGDIKAKAQRGGGGLRLQSSPSTVAYYMARGRIFFVGSLSASKTTTLAAHDVSQLLRVPGS